MLSIKSACTTPSDKVTTCDMSALFKQDPCLQHTVKNTTVRLRKDVTCIFGTVPSWCIFVQRSNFTATCGNQHTWKKSTFSLVSFNVPSRSETIVSPCLAMSRLLAVWGISRARSQGSKPAKLRRAERRCPGPPHGTAYRLGTAASLLRSDDIRLIMTHQHLGLLRCGVRGNINLDILRYTYRVIVIVNIPDPHCSLHYYVSCKVPFFG